MVYKNTLQDFKMCKEKTDAGSVLVPERKVNIDFERSQNDFNALLEYYDEYINDKDRFISEIWEKIESVTYVNGGLIPDPEWEHNKHIFVINGEFFEYKTGIGIDCQQNKSTRYNQYKLLLDCVYSVLTDSWYAINYTEDDFVEELGYTDSVKSYKTGIQVYADTWASYRRAKEIWNKQTIASIYDIMQL